MNDKCEQKRQECAGSDFSNVSVEEVQLQGPSVIITESGRGA